MDAVIQAQKLSDGREFRALPGKYTQAETFELKNRGLWNPQTEGIATVKQLDDALNVAKVYSLVLGDQWSRSDAVGFYRKGFENDLSLQMGKKVVWMEKERDINRNETGRLLVATLDLSKIADVKVKLVDGSEMTLQQAIGMGIIPLSKLEIRKTEDNQKLVAYEVSVASDFNPATDLMVKNVARPRSWSTAVDTDGYALNDRMVSDQVGWNTASARFSSVKHSDDFLNVNQLSRELQTILTKMGIKSEEMGLVASVGRGVDDLGFYEGGGRGVSAISVWSYVSRVAIVGRSAIAPLIVGTAKLEVVKQEPEVVTLKGSEEQIQALLRVARSQNLL